MITAAIFDKDGTLFDFRESWGGWTARLIEALCALGADQGTLAQLLGFDLATKTFAPDSVVIAATTYEIAERIAPATSQDFATVYRLMNDLAETAPMVPAVDLDLILRGLKQRGLVIGLATNDTEVPAHAQLDRAGVLDLFDFVAGCDSGWGGKPAPGQLNAFVAKFGLDPRWVAMVGDSKHDLEAARSAGMRAVAVLTGIATHDDLAPYADVVLQDISQLDAWIDAQTA
jgi:phosphoglycolate phosphatase